MPQNSHRNTAIARMPPCQLNRGLIGLGARITKERLIRTRILAQPRGQLSLGRGIIQIRNMMYLRHLMTNRIGQVLIVMPQCTGGNAGHEVQIGFAGVVGEGGAISGNEGDGISTVGLLNARIEESGRGGKIKFGGGS